MPVNCTVSLYLKSHVVITNVPHEVSNILISLRTPKFKKVKILPKITQITNNGAQIRFQSRLALEFMPSTTLLLEG